MGLLTRAGDLDATLVAYDTALAIVVSAKNEAKQGPAGRKAGRTGNARDLEKQRRTERG